MAGRSTPSWRLEVSRKSGAKYYFNESTGQSLWHDDALPPGWAWSKDRESTPKYYVHLETGRRQDEPPSALTPVAGVKRRGGAIDEVRAHAEKQHLHQVHRRWEECDGVLNVALELVLPDVVSGGMRRNAALIASGWFLRVHATTGAVILDRDPQFLALSCTSATVGASSGKLRLQVTAGDGAALCCVRSDAGDGFLLRCVKDGAGTQESAFTVHCSDYADLAAGGLQCLTLAAEAPYSGGRVELCIKSECRALSVLSAPSPEADALSMQGACGLAAAVGRWRASEPAAWAADISTTWLPCLLRPVFQGRSLSLHSVFTSSSDGATAAAAPALGLYRMLGVTPGFVATGFLAQGERSKVTRFALLEPATSLATPLMERPVEAETQRYVLKSQKWDARVQEEIAVLDVLSTPRRNAGEEVAVDVTRSEAGQQPLRSIMRPLTHHRDEEGSFMVLPDYGLSLKDWATQHRLPVLVDLLASSADGCNDDSPALLTATVSPTTKPDAAARYLLAQLLTALHEMHSRGVLFRDMHPGNVLCKARKEAGGRCDVTVIDFGSAVRVPPGASSGSSVRHRGKTRGGRWDCMPQEQFGTGRWADGGEVSLSEASDMFSAAATVLYVIGGGEAPFGGPAGFKLSVDSCLTRHPRRQYPALVAYVRGILPDNDGGDVVRSVLLRCLDPDMSLRFQTAEAALRALCSRVL